MTTTIDELARHIAPQAMGQARISLDAFIEAYNKGDAELVDIRLPDEVAVWPVNEPLTANLLVIACTMTDRSNRAGP